VLDRHASGKPSSARSKRWWTDDIEQERRLFGRARRDYNRDRISFDEYRRVRNDYHRYIRRAKRIAWEHFLEGAFATDEGSKLASDPGRCWRALRYTKAQVPSYTPAIKIGDIDGQPDRSAATDEEKKRSLWHDEILGKTLQWSLVGIGERNPVSVGRDHKFGVFRVWVLCLCVPLALVTNIKDILVTERRAGAV
jgi:hypothetical protein